MVRMLRLVLCALVLYQTTVLASQPEVVLQQGALKGLWAHSAGGRTYAAFYGIPYAKPPQGKHRFKEPVPAEPWLGIYNATKEPPKCLQLSYFSVRTPRKLEGSEDCLYVNVFTPKLNTTGTDGKLLDVIAYIHGGALMAGSSNDMGVDYILDRNIVLVSFNYRLGPLGFFSTGDVAVPGNNGMKDQVLALKWIQENIAAFGGDPNSVTLAGGSAGSASVHYHVLSPLSKGLFKGAICASGSSLNPWAFAENVREKSFFVARELGCPAEDSLSMIKCLRRRPAEHIVETTNYFLSWFYNPISPYALVVEAPGPNAFLPDTPMNLLKQARGSDVPMMITFSKDEGLFPAADVITSPQLSSELKADWNQLLPHLFDYNYTVPCEKRRDEVSQEIRNYYNIDLDSKEGQKNLIRALSDRLFINGIAKAARLHSGINTSPVYLLRFSYSGKHSYASLTGMSENLGVGHGEDAIYVFSMKGMSIQETETDQQVSKQLIDLWISFAANGTLDIQTVNQNLPKFTFTDYQGPDQLVPMMVDEMGEEKFWDSLNLKENIESVLQAHQEL
ncbi:esterase FE4 [Halyomorpha halys]|uniref:esterase FE4 n=1 Tax=Halyomorpha halys TaxID=286706 RepID=UPI0006D4F87D|nr:esterase FE4-like [Halyomorpha halys]